MQSIAILGLGAMGSRMAAKLLDAGFKVTVYNRDPGRADALVERGGLVSETPCAAARDAEIVISMLRDDAASRAVWSDPRRGALLGLSPTAVAIESSTLTPAWVAELSVAVAATGAGFLDAPVAGSRPQAEAGQLVHLVGGAVLDLERARPALRVLGSALHHLGPVGSGMLVKLAVNALFAVQIASLGEMLGLFRKSGIDVEAALAALSATPVASPAVKVTARAIQAANFAPQFPIELVEKDLNYVAAAAQAVAADAPLAAAASVIYGRALAQGFGGDNISGVAKLFD